jgi:ubiquinone/menaquinone biosynthesis C-methylase UbiE
MTKPEDEWEAFIQMLSPSNSDRILDVGAGDGSVASRVLGASNGGEIYAVDPGERKVSAMKRNHPAIRSSVAAAESLPFPDSFFDKVYSTRALHHFADLDRALSELARVLKNGGSFVILEVEPRSFMGRAFRFFGRLMGEKMHFFSEPQLRARLESSKDFSLGRSVSLGCRYLIQLTRN